MPHLKNVLHFLFILPMSQSNLSQYLSEVTACGSPISGPPLVIINDTPLNYKPIKLATYSLKV